MRNADYWRDRFSILEEAAHKQSDRYLQSLEGMYQEAALSVRKEIEAWYGRFAVNNQISLTEARKRLNAGQLEEFHWTVEQYVKNAQQANLSPEWIRKLENASARYHVSRLEAVQLQIQQQIELLYGNQVDEVDALLKDLISNGYTHGVFEFQKGIGLGWDFTDLDQRKLDLLLSKPWTTDGRTFRDRCWSNKAALVDGVHKELIQGMLRGDAPAKTITAIQKRFGVSRYQAGRLVHTETSYFSALSKKQMYQDLGVEEIEVVETLDSHTCPICQPLDGMVIPLAQYEPGVTVPPFHPNCRGTTCPHYDDMEGERAARSADGNVYYVPADMTYEAWKMAFVDGGPKDGLTLAAADAIIRLTQDEQRALNEYISSGSYKINAALRGGEVLSEEQKMFLGHLDAALGKMPTYQGVVIRSLLLDQDSLLKFAKQHAIGSEVCYIAYSSASSQTGYHQKPTVLLKIHSKTGRDIRSYNPDENEVIFRRNTHFRTLDVTVENGVYILEMEELS